MLVSPMKVFSISIVPFQSSSAIHPIGCPSLLGEWRDLEHHLELRLQHFGIGEREMLVADLGHLEPDRSRPLPQPLNDAFHEAADEVRIGLDGIVIDDQRLAQRLDAQIGDPHAIDRLPFQTPPGLVRIRRS